MIQAQILAVGILAVALAFFMAGCNDPAKPIDPTPIRLEIANYGKASKEQRTIIGAAILSDAKGHDDLPEDVKSFVADLKQL